MQNLKKDYYSLEEVAKECHCTVNDLLHFGETGRLKMCVVLPPTIVEITRLTPINELDENSYWAKLINEPHEDSEQAKGEDPPEFIHELVKMGEISGLYYLFAGDVLSIRKEEEKEKEEKEEGIESVHDGNFDTNRMFYHFLDDNGRRTKKKFDITDLVITHEEKSRFEAICDLVRNSDIGEKERTTWLKIIYLLMHELADCKPVLVKTDGLNVSQFETLLKKTAKKHELSDKKLSDSNLGRIYNEALTELMPDPPPRIKLKKITK